MKLDIIEPEHIVFHGLFIRADNFKPEFMLALIELVNTHIQLAGRDHAVVEKVDRFAELFAVQINLNDAVINRFCKLHFQTIRRSFLHGHSQIERVTRLGIDPPQVCITAPTGTEAVHILQLGAAGRLCDDFQLLALQRAFDFKDFYFAPVPFALLDRHRLIRIALSGRLVPVHRRSIQRRLAVRIIFLDGGLERTLERHVVGDVPAVHGDVAAIAHADRLIVVAVGKQFRVAPGVAEIILGAGPDSRGEFLAVHEEFLVTLAPPSAARIPHVQHNAAEPPPPLRLEHRPVDHPALGIFGQKIISMPLGVKPSELLNRLCNRSMTDCKTNLAFLLPIISQFYQRAFAKRHIPVTIKSFFRHTQRQGFIPVHARSGPEEISQRRADTRFRFAVPVNPQNKLTKYVPVIGRFR